MLRLEKLPCDGQGKLRCRRLIIAPVEWTKLNNKMGSRYNDDNVPNVNFNPNNSKVNVNYVNPDNRNSNWRARSEVTA